MPQDVDDLTIAELAAAAQVDRRSIRKVLRGGKVRGLAGARIKRVFCERGIASSSAASVPPVI